MVADVTFADVVADAQALGVPAALAASDVVAGCVEVARLRGRIHGLLAQGVPFEVAVSRVAAERWREVCASEAAADVAAEARLGVFALGMRMAWEFAGDVVSHLELCAAMTPVVLSPR